ncbi:MAG TPA: 4-alpha-glucanotransferase [Flavihumibacter sp.]|nr:4-alpha-glucanotransferase [Flavihumibacter sp.]
MKIQFYLRFHTKFGQQLYVTGLESLLSTAAPLEMTYLNNDYWTASVELDRDASFQYQYLFQDTDGSRVKEWGDDRQLFLSTLPDRDLHLVDTWNYPGEFENAFYSAPFQEILLPEHKPKKAKANKKATQVFNVKAPLLGKQEQLCICGSGPELGDWNTDHAVLMQPEGNWWTVALSIPKESLPISYKYGVYNHNSKKFKYFEAGENRQLFGDADNTTTIVHDGFAHFLNNTWRGAGVAIPVFSLRSKKSHGVGEFTDIPLLVDWAAEVGMKLIQLLPVNDTTNTGTWTDSYPYNANSAFALHPLYLNLETVAGKKHAALLKPFKKKREALNALQGVDYEAVMTDKLEALHLLYEASAGEWLEEAAFQDFYSTNKHWLLPYAAFCQLRDRFGTTHFDQWKQHRQYDAAAIERYVSPRLKHYDQIRFYYYMQYQLHLQLLAAAKYAHKQGVILKGDIPIGIARYSCDAWVNPSLYHLDQQAGAPPDAFATKGQNWGFPTYNWEQMKLDGFAWWKQRFAQMSSYFDAFRIDHILGFFRIWSIPIYSVEGIMGKFVPAIPVRRSEFTERNTWFEYHRYTRPYITEKMLDELFGESRQYVEELFLEPTGFGEYFFKADFDTQAKVATWFAALKPDDDRHWLKQSLFDLLSNVILFEEPGSNGQAFHFRFAIEQTSSFQQLEWHTQQALKELYVDYYFRRQDALWQRDALEILPALKASTNMLICGEDLGLVPGCVPTVMTQLGILSLELQRMPKDPGRAFFHPNDAPYLSVVTPSTHDMSTVRGWWEEDRVLTQRFFNEELGQWGEAPTQCEPWISKAIVFQHLHSPAMWSIFQLQDLLACDEGLRLPNPDDERINIPAIAQHYWRYRMPITLEALGKEKHFNAALKEMIKTAER